MTAMSLRERPRLLLGATALVSLAAIGAALVSQYAFDILPCPWCVLQRLIFALLALAAVVGLLLRSTLGQRVVGGALMLLAVEGIVAALWQHFVAAASDSCKLTFADRVMNGLGLDAALPSVFQAQASCADAAVNLLGVPYEFYSLALFILICFGGALVLAQPARAGTAPR